MNIQWRFPILIPAQVEPVKRPKTTFAKSVRTVSDLHPKKTQKVQEHFRRFMQKNAIKMPVPRFLHEDDQFIPKVQPGPARRLHPRCAGPVSSTDTLRSSKTRPRGAEGFVRTGGWPIGGVEQWPRPASQERGCLEHDEHRRTLCKDLGS